jgi:glutathione S-transferase
VIERHKNGGLKPSVDSELYPQYLQWFYYCEGMVVPPVNTIVVQTVFLPPDRRDEKALGQARRLLLNLKGYVGRVEARPAFQKAITMQ